MSIYNYNFKNQIDLRCRDATMESLKVWDAAQQKYVPVTGGGGDNPGPAVLPYYVKDDHLQFQPDGALISTRVDEYGLILGTGNGEERVTYDSVYSQRQQLEEVTGTVLPAHEASLEELDGRTATNKTSITALEKKMSSVESMNYSQNLRITDVENASTAQKRDITTLQTTTTSQGTKITSLENADTAKGTRITTLETSDAEKETRLAAVETNNSAQNPKITALENKTVRLYNNNLSFTVAGAGGSMKSLFDKDGMTTYSGTAVAAVTNPSTKINPTSLTFTDASGGTVYIDLSRADSLAKLASVTTPTFNVGVDFPKKVSLSGATESTDLSSKKMVVMDSTSKELSWGTVPDASSYINSEKPRTYVPDSIANGADYAFSSVEWTTNITPAAWKVPVGVNAMSKYSGGIHYLISLANQPFTGSETTVSSGKNYAFCIDGLSVNDIVSCLYYPSEADTMNVSGITAYPVPVSFRSTTARVNMVRIRLFHSALTGTTDRYLYGKLQITVRKAADMVPITPATQLATG